MARDEGTKLCSNKRARLDETSCSCSPRAKPLSMGVWTVVRGFLLDGLDQVARGAQAQLPCYGPSPSRHGL